MTDSKSRSPAPAAPDDEKEAVAWQLTVDGVPLWNEASFYRTDGDAMDALAEGDMGNGLIPLYLHPAGRSPAEVPPPFMYIVFNSDGEHIRWWSRSAPAADVVAGFAAVGRAIHELHERKEAK